MKVLVQSFSFHRTGYPEDNTGKGGGFVFDCRAIDACDYSLDRMNAEFPYINLTGLDREVIDLLNNDHETQEFFQAVWTLVRINLEKCLRRGFGVMTVNFGCTAGRHRSVYMAERLARKLRDNLIEVELVHLERSSWPTKN